MFKKDITPGTKSKLKSSVQRGIRQSVLTTFPLLTPHIDAVLPKKADLTSIKLPDRAILYAVDGVPSSSSPTAPRGPSGAVRFVLSGATLMAPGLTSVGGRLPEPRDGPAPNGAAEGEVDGHWSRELAKGEVVVVMAEGKTEACAVGILVEGTEGVKEKKKGPVIEEAHYLGDGLWNINLD
ncbi:unnamed protein product [Parascedosporium putredinis]|uniref:Pre-PUA domain-containing protein n=1 Tax=Parascedosporium putredinis TaxID=1442378 RepID=A0A9P1M8S8_9PEZI|nr:unnamed protein product [Parascedosporium putredinis]CAI7989489.1 unnamed protein product [Parascedosporium putredinis]